VPAFRIVEALNIIEDVGLGVIPRSVHSARSPLGLQRREEALHRRVVPDVFLGYAVPRWAYAAAGPAVHYDDTPSYADRSKFGGDAALPVH